MVKFDEQIRRKQLQVISLLFDVNTDIDSEYEAHKLVYDGLKKIKDENNLENFSMSLFIRDDAKKKWKQGTSDPNIFIKLFHNEISYAKNTYGLTRGELGFLYSLTGLLLWESNLLVDADGTPLNQNRLAKVLEIDRKTVYNNTKALEQKKCLIRMWDGKDVYYLINPYLMYFGEKIIKKLPEIFEMTDYIPLKNNKKDNDKNTDNIEV